MATKRNVSTQRISYGYPGAQFPNLESAVSMAKLEYNRARKQYGDKLMETFDRALVTEDTSIYLKLTCVEKS
jgi:hypothetical protein